MDSKANRSMDRCADEWVVDLSGVRAALYKCT